MTLRGRDRERAFLTAFFARPQPSPLFLYGRSGSGKTALVQEHLKGLSCPVHWVDLSLWKSSINALKALLSSTLNSSGSVTRGPQTDFCGTGLPLERFAAAVSRLDPVEKRIFVLDGVCTAQFTGVEQLLEGFSRIAEFVPGACWMCPVFVSSVPLARFEGLSHLNHVFRFSLSPLSTQALEHIVADHVPQLSDNNRRFVVSMLSTVCVTPKKLAVMARSVAQQVDAGATVRDACKGELGGLFGVSVVPLEGEEVTSASAYTSMTKLVLLASFFASNTEPTCDDILWSRHSQQRTAGASRRRTMQGDVVFLDQPRAFTFSRLRRIVQLIGWDSIRTSRSVPKCSKQEMVLRTHRATYGGGGEPPTSQTGFLDDDSLLSQLATLAYQGHLQKPKSGNITGDARFRCTLKATDVLDIARSIDSIGEKMCEPSPVKLDTAHFATLIESLM